MTRSSKKKKKNLNLIMSYNLIWNLDGLVFYPLHLCRFLITQVIFSRELFSLHVKLFCIKSQLFITWICRFKYKFYVSIICYINKVALNICNNILILTWRNHRLTSWEWWKIEIYILPKKYSFLSFHFCLSKI